MARTSALARVLPDHDEIRRWAEERGAKPARVRGISGDGDVGMIRLDFPGYSGEESVEEISWDDWFRKFDESNLALLVQDERRVEKRAISTNWFLAIQCCKVPGKQASVRARIVVDGALQRRDGAELRELAGAPLPLGPAAKKGNRAFVARVIAARTVEDRREATVRVLQVRDKLEAEVAPKAALHARTARRHRVGGRNRELQGREVTQSNVLSENGRCQQRGAPHEDVRRSLGL